MSAAPHKMSICFLMDAPVASLAALPSAPALALPGSFSPVTAPSKVLPPKRVHRRKLSADAGNGGPKKPRKSRVVFDFPLETLAQYFHLSQRDAAKQLGVSAITIKRNCKRHKIMWPFRTNKQQAAYIARERAESRSSIDARNEQGDRRDEENDETDDEEGEGEVQDDDMCDADTVAAAATQAAQTFALMSYLHLTEESGERNARHVL